MQGPIASIIVKTVRRRFQFLIVVILVFSGAAAHSLGLQAGVGSGVLFAENPGATYTAPSTASATVRLGEGAWYADARLMTAPFLALQERFEDSLMLVAELSLGAALPLRVYPHGSWFLGASLDGGGYLRTPGTTDRGPARRPVAGGTLWTGFESRLGWQYGLSLRYRAFLDKEPVHSFEPALSILYRLKGKRGGSE
jgi:hypothetical protein